MKAMVLTTFRRSDRNWKSWTVFLAVASLCLVYTNDASARDSEVPQHTAQQTEPRIPQTVTGRLDENSDQLVNGSYFVTHTFEGRSGEILAIELTSDDYDSNLVFLDSNWRKIAEADGSDGINTLASLTLHQPDSYTIVVNTTQPEEPRYQLQWQSTTDQNEDLAEAARLHQRFIELQQAGRYPEAIVLAQQVLALIEKSFGPNHPQTALSLNNLAEAYHFMGRDRDAEPLYQRALRINETTLGLDHPSTALSLNNLAGFLYRTGRYRDAEPLYQRALAIFEQVLGVDHADTVQVLNNLARLYASTGNYGESESLHQRALLIREQTLGSVHPLTSQSLNNLAALYYLMGRYGEAEPLYQQALAIRKQVLGLDHPDTATSLNNLAGLYQSMGRYREAEPLYQQALAIRERTVGSVHHLFATTLNNLAFLYQSMERYEEAKLLYEQALAIRKQVLGLDHPSTAISLNNLAGLYRSTGDYDKQLPLLQRALSINEQALGANHPNTAISLNNLGDWYRLMERYEESELFYQRALTINEKVLGFDHSSTANSLTNLSALYLAQGQIPEALSYLGRGLAVEETVLSRNLVVGSDANKRDYLSTVFGTTNGIITLHLEQLPTNPEATSLAFTTVLQRKGRILDLFTNLRSRLAQDPDALELFDQLREVNDQISALNNNPNPADPTYQDRLNTLRTQLNSLENQLSRRSQEFANLTASPSLVDVQAQLPAGTALVEFIRYRPFNPQVHPTEQLGSPRYAAYLLTSEGTIQGIDLGSAEEIDSAVATLARSLASARTPQNQVEEDAQALDTLVMAPVREALGDTTTVFISPDGALNLIPFEALVDESGQYLVETYQFRYLTSGRDLMRLDQTNPSTQPAVLVGNPTYGRPGAMVAVADTRTIDFKNRIFPALPGTQAEIDGISPLLPGAESFSGNNATEALIKQQVQPSILHIATHGFFEPLLQAVHPLLQSGLVMAGAAAGGQSGPDQDGLLTALEVTGLNLRGTQLVVLSACETGLGELAAGEGLYGLRRALVLAGSQSQVISLWKVDDTATQEWMVEYYNRLLAGVPRDQAMRETQRAFLAHPDYNHPYYWAAFIGSGDWRPLQLGQ